MPICGDGQTPNNERETKTILKWLLPDWIWAYALHHRNFLARINVENFLRGANERNTRLRQEVIFARAFEALQLCNAIFARYFAWIDREI